MSRRLKELIAIIETWPAERRQDAEQMLSALVDRGADIYRPSDDEGAAIELSLAQARRREFVSDEEVAAVRRKHGL